MSLGFGNDYFGQVYFPNNLSVMINNVAAKIIIIIPGINIRVISYANLAEMIRATDHDMC